MTGSCVFCCSSCISFNPTSYLKILAEKFEGHFESEIKHKKMKENTKKYIIFKVYGE